MKPTRVVLLLTACVALALGGAACAVPVPPQRGVEATVQAIVALTEQARSVQATVSALETALAGAKASATATATSPPKGADTEPTATRTASPPPSPTSTFTVRPPPSTTAPDLYVSEFALDPATPTQGKPVVVRVGVYNKGNATAGAFKVQWFAGEDYPSPACEWTIDSMVANGGRILTCNYPGYPSWYAKLNTKVVVDFGKAVAESNEDNNIFRREISVSQPVAARLSITGVTFSTSSPVATKDPVWPKVTIKNEGGSPSAPFEVLWRPKPDADQQEVKVDRTLAAGESIVVEFPAYTYPVCGVFSTNIALSGGGASRNETITVAKYCPPVQTATPDPERQYKTDYKLSLGPGGAKDDKNVGGLCDAGYHRSRSPVVIPKKWGFGSGDCSFLQWADNDPHMCLATIHLWVDTGSGVDCFIQIYEVGDPKSTPTPPPSCSCRP